jgi:ABC-type Fe3+ transport system permease subunit
VAAPGIFVLSFASVLAVSCGRALLVAGAAAIAARAVNRLLTDSRGVLLWTLWLLLVIPWLVPGLLVGYAWNGWIFAIHSWSVRSGVTVLTSFADLALRHDRVGNELILCCLLFFRCLLWAVVMLRWGGRREENETSWYLRGLADRAAGSGVEHGLSNAVRRLRRDVRRLAPATGLAFITCFQEYELVARLGRASWTVWLIDAQATGVAVSGLLVRATLAAMLQTMLVGGLLPVRHGLFHLERNRPGEAPCVGGHRVLLVGMLLLGAIATMAVPLVSLTGGFVQGLSALTDRTAVLRRLVGEVSVGAAVAIVAAIAAITFARCLEISPTESAIPQPDRNGVPAPRAGGLAAVKIWGQWGLSWLGAWGAVPLSLLTIYSLAASGLTVLNQTVFPWFLVQSIWLFPRAVCLMSLVRVWRQPEMIHLGTLLSRAPDADRRKSAHQLWWRENWRNPVMAGLFLAMTAYFDLPTGQLLAPAGLASAPVTLYTQMHYGRNSLLTAMTLLAVAIPWTLAILALIVLPRLTIWRRRHSNPLGGWSRSR